MEAKNKLKKKSIYKIMRISSNDNAKWIKQISAVKV